MPNQHAITGIILAGGRSSRMGYDKGLMKINGQPAIERIIGALSPLTDRILIIANNDAYDYLHLPVYSDIIKSQGPIGGIYTGLTLSNTGKNLVVACDMPFISTSLLEFILAEIEFYEIGVPVFKGETQPLCACYLKHTGMTLKQLMSHHILRMQEVVRFFHYKRIAIDSTLRFYRPELGWNLNTPIEFKKVSGKTL